MAGTRQNRSGPKAPLTGAVLRKAILAIWCVCFLRPAVAGDMDSSATFRSARCTPCSPAGPCGAGCSTA